MHSKIEKYLFLLFMINIQHIPRARGSNFYVVRPNLVSVLCWVVACASTLKVWGLGTCMLPQENLKFTVSETASGSF